MTYAASAVAYWVGKYNTSQTDLANQTAATVAEHNARYVNGAGTGQLWSENAAYWQAQYNAELALYNQAAADRDTWHTRADQAWGASQVWGAGIAYSAQRPPAGMLYLSAGLTLPGLSSGGGTADAAVNTIGNSLAAGVSGGVITVPKTGQYSLAGGFKGSNATGNNETLRVSLVSSQHGTLDTADTNIKVSSYFGGSFMYVGPLNAGETLHLQFQTSFDAINGDGKLLLAFVPVLATPN